MSEKFEEEEDDDDDDDDVEQTTTIIDINQDESNANKSCFLTLKFSYNQNDEIEIDIIDKVKNNKKDNTDIRVSSTRTLKQNKQDPIILREHPPPMPPQQPNRVISLPGRVLPPPPRQVIIERVPSPPLPPPPRDIIIERWLDYPKQEPNLYRRIIHEQEQTNAASTSSVSNRNLIVDWTFDGEEKQGPSPPATHYKINYLGVETVSPREYLKKYAHDEFLIDPSQMSALTNELNLRVPDGEALAAESRGTNNG